VAILVATKTNSPRLPARAARQLKPARLPAIATTATAATATTAATTTAAFAAVVATAAATAVPATAITTTAAVTTTTAITTTTAAVATAATGTVATATAAATARLALLGLVDAERATIEGTAIHTFDSLRGLLGGSHRHEREAARTAGLAIRDEVDITDGSELLERGADALSIGVERKISNVQTSVHRLLDLARNANPTRPRGGHAVL
jgi:hypothetical protein